MGKLTVHALRAVLVVVLAGTVFVQAGMVWALATDPEDGSLPLTPLRVITILGMVSGQVALVCVWRLVTMVRRGTVFSHAAFRYVDVMIGAIVAAALMWFAVTVLNAPGQRADPGVTVSRRPSPSRRSRSRCRAQKSGIQAVTPCRRTGSKRTGHVRRHEPSFGYPQVGP